MSIIRIELVSLKRVILWEIALGRPLPPALTLPGVVLTMLALALLLKNEDPA